MWPNRRQDRYDQRRMRVKGGETDLLNNVTVLNGDHDNDCERAAALYSSGNPDQLNDE